MTIKSKVMALSLIGFVSISMADTTFFDHNAVSITGDNSPYGYKILINQLETRPNPNNNILYTSSRSSTIQKVGDPIWSFTTRQLPISDDNCLETYSGACTRGEDKYCYHYCLMGNPDIVAFDEKANKLYLMHGTTAIGTGGGPAFLFVADINKKEIRLLHVEGYQEQGSLSPSGRYLVIHGNSSVLKLYDTQNYNRSELNKSENTYDEGKSIRHSLRVKKWLSDMQFTYIDIARYFVRPYPSEGEPFFSAKEVSYDIASKQILKERHMTEKEATDFEKSLQKSI